MTELHPKIKDALIKIDFVKRYEELSNKYSSERTPSNNRLVYIDGEEVLEMIQELGYHPLFNSREKFYKIKEEKIGNFVFGVHIILRWGMMELVWVVKENGELLLGSPWGTYSKKLISNNYIVKSPFFGDYEDLEEILKITFKMYEDFKLALTGD